MADGLGGMPRAAEVDAFEAEIRRDESFVPRWDAKGSAVVADADENRRAGFCPGEDASDDRLFAKRQAKSNI
jgi:hypothetical protein